MKISDDSIEKVKSYVDIVDVIGEYVQLKKVGQNYRGLSPFTNEKSPSFYVSPSKEIFKCFSSGKGGDAIKFITEFEGVGYLEAIKILADKYGIELEMEELSEEAVLKQSTSESLLIVLNHAAEYFHHTLLESDEGRSIGLSYFKERGFNEKIIKEFDLGYSLEKWDGLYKEALSKGYKEEFLEKAGLIIKKEDKAYDRFRGRVIFPIHSVSGKVIAFGGRVLKLDPTKKQPKYVNSPETEVYHKSKVLYGIYQAKQAIRQFDECYLVEGYTDVISMHMSDVANVVASSGTSLTDDQIRLISRYTKNITVLFDGDAAGIKAAMRGIDMILEKGLNVKVLVFPEGEDPDSYSQKLGADEFKKFLKENATDFVSYKLKIYSEEAKTSPQAKAESIKAIVESISKIPDPIKRTVYTQQASTHLNVDEDLLIAEENKLIIQKRRNEQKQAARDKFKGDEPLPPEPPEVLPAEEDQPVLASHVDNYIESQESELIRVLLSYGHHEMDEDGTLIGHFILEEIDGMEMITAEYNTVLTHYREIAAEGGAPDIGYFMTFGDEILQQKLVNMFIKPHEVSENWEKKHLIFVPSEEDHLHNVINGVIIRLKLAYVKKMLHENKEKLKELTDSEEIIQCMRIQKELKNLEKEYAQALGNVIIFK
ncbi:DNA primase [Marinigracilibium pacificum]|uniref:DNA primase n=1 Tax=Marinigracilibium pacificum TaxID=2729599 RepID=A0A848J8A7_9BACT|nr:DNA primase [Marinigracilibium pacificum]NMM49302.1 DNA primase [Marinigracilibium pacificum]